MLSLGAEALRCRDLSNNQLSGTIAASISLTVFALRFLCVAPLEPCAGTKTLCYRHLSGSGLCGSVSENFRRALDAPLPPCPSLPPNATHFYATLPGPDAGTPGGWSAATTLPTGGFSLTSGSTTFGSNGYTLAVVFSYTRSSPASQWVNLLTLSSSCVARAPCVCMNPCRLTRASPAGCR